MKFNKKTINIIIFIVLVSLLSVVNVHAYSLSIYHMYPYSTHVYSIGSDISNAGVSAITSAASNWELGCTYFSRFGTNTEKSSEFNLNDYNEVYKGNFGSDNFLALAWVSYDHYGIVLEGDILINIDYPMATEEICPSGYFHLKSIVMHEFGHIVGFDHSLDTNAIMYAYFSKGEMRNINTDDQNGYYAIYSRYS